MAFQMVYTSVRSGLVAGRSGFCTAARHREIKESLVARLEDFSAQYDRGVAAGGPLPIVYQHRIVTIRDQRYHVLMRLADAGNDYTGRTNHIAHSLVIEPSEIANLSLSPAEAILALSKRGFWRSHYDEPARFFGMGDTVDLGELPRCASLPAARWQESTGSPANAAQLFDSGGPVDAGLVVSGTGEEDDARILALFAESLLLLDPGRSTGGALWSVPFTTVLQSSAERSQFRWCGILEDGPVIAQESRAGRKVISLAAPPSPPTGAFADLAEGRAPRLAPAVPVERGPSIVGSSPVSADPGAMALGQAPAAGPVPERVGVSVPLSIEDPRRAKRSAKSRKNPARTVLLCAAVVVLLLAAAGMFVFWHGNKEVWEEERRIGEMVEAEKWKEIHQALKTKGPDSEKLREWEEIAKAIARYGEITENPQQFLTIVPGSDTVDEAIKTIREEWEGAKIASSERLRKKVEDAGNAANNSAKKWSPTVEKVRSGSKRLRDDLENYSDPAHEAVRKHVDVLAGSLETLEAECATWDLSSLESTHNILAMVRDSILPGLSLLAEIDRKHPINADLNEPADRASKSSERLVGESRKLEAKGGGDEKFRKEISGVCNELIARLGKLSDVRGFVREEPPPAPKTLEPPKPDPSVAAAVAAKKEPLPPRTFLMKAGTDGVIDFSGIDGAPNSLPKGFEILPVSALVSGDGVKGQIAKAVGEENYYDEKRKFVIFRKSGRSKLKKEGSTDFWNPFSGGYLIRIPKSAEGADEDRYLVLDAIPEDQGSTKTAAFATKPCETFLKRGAPGEVALSESVAAILKRITPATGDPAKYPLKYRLTLAGDFPVASEWVGDPSAIMLRVTVTIQERLAGIQDSKKLQKSAEEARKSVESRYTNLGRDLFPQFFEKEAPNEMASKVDKKNPAGGLPPVVHGTFSDFSKGARLQRVRLSDYMEYVKSLFASLEALSKGSEQYNSAHQHIEKYIEKGRQVQPVNGLPKEAVAWHGLTQAWSTSSNFNPTPSSSDAKSMQTERDAKQIQKKYFEDFFRVWNERFNEEAVKKLINDLDSIQKAEAAPPPEQLESEVKRLEATKTRLENADLTDDGEYTLELLLEEANPASPQPSRQVITLIRGAR
jgi:hypothetical protein